MRSDDIRAGTTYVAPAVSLARLLENVRLPSGRGALDAGATVKARCESVPVAPGEVLESWRSVPIRVTVSLAGFREITFDFRLDGDAVPRILQPLE